MEIPRSERIVWAAGFFDGEGSVSIRRHSKRNQYWLCLDVSQVVIDPLLILKDLFGGTININNGGIKRGWRVKYSWQVRSRQALTALREMQPYLVVKAKHSIIAQEFAETLSKQGRLRKEDCAKFAQQDGLRQKMRQLNQRGIPIDTTDRV